MESLSVTPTTGNRLQKKKQEEVKLTIKSKSQKIEPSVMSDLTRHLLKMGYQPVSIKFFFEKFTTTDINQILNILSKNERGIYNHEFYPLKNHKIEPKENSKSSSDESLCILCLEKKKFHPCSEEESQFNSSFENNISNINLISKNDNELSSLNTFNPKNFSRNSLIKVNTQFIDNLEKEFKEKNNLCIICYANELNDTNSTTLECGHRFCNECIQHYVINSIQNGNASNIKCLMAGCLKNISEEVIKKMIPSDIFEKYIRFKKRNFFMNNINKNLIPCVYPDCEEWVEVTGEKFITCQKGHCFCPLCKESAHPGKKCKMSEFEKMLKKMGSIKPCPNCRNLIEKIDGCNHMVCSLCGYEFCWLCLKKYTRYHFSMFNVSGCPGMKFMDPEKSKISKNSFVQCLWFFLSFILGLLLILLVGVFFIFFGATYEFINCYEKKRYEKEEENGIVKYNNNPKSSRGDIVKRIFIYIGLTILGMSMQFFYVLFKLLKFIIECYRKYGCWFLYPRIL